MASVDDQISHLRQLFEDERDAEEKLQERQRTMKSGDFDDNRERYERPVREAQTAIAKFFEEKILRYGLHYDRHGSLLKNFFASGRYEESAFIMTKYPQGNSVEAKRLQHIINLVSDTVKAAGFEPRIAKNAQYHVGLWDNVELHALGCCLGIAIAESRYAPEFNPNVAMEWGWMRGNGRPVIALVEKGFQLRADVEGIIRESFDWDDPDETIPAAITNAITTLKNAGRLP
jgi:hypothetical protein